MSEVMGRRGGSPVFNAYVEDGVSFDLDEFLDDEGDLVELEPVSCRDTDPVPGFARERDTIPCPPPDDMDVVFDLLRYEDDPTW